MPFNLKFNIFSFVLLIKSKLSKLLFSQTSSIRLVFLLKSIFLTLLFVNSYFSSAALFSKFNVSILLFLQISVLSFLFLLKSKVFLRLFWEQSR